MSEKVDASEINAVVIPRKFTPPCAVKAIVSVLIDVFGSASSSYILDEKPCEKTVMVDQEYRGIFNKIQKKYRRKNYIYVTEMPFFIVLHRVETSDTLWYITITNVMKLVKEGHYDSHAKMRESMGGIVTIPYSAKKMKKRLDEKVREDAK